MKGVRAVERIVILMAEDDEGDRILVREAMREARSTNDLRFVRDGVELFQYLNRQGPYAQPGAAPRPGLILLDINMPRMEGREVLEHIKGDASLKMIPVVVLTTSQKEEDILRAYDLGAASFITKPVTFPSLVQVVRALESYWMGIVTLPLNEEDSHEQYTYSSRG